jgi:hypothetical protein
VRKRHEKYMNRSALESRLDFELNESWIRAVAMDAEEEFPELLIRLGEKADLQVVGQEYADIKEDPVKEAFIAALSKQSEIVKIDRSESLGSQQKWLSAEELTKDWGFRDPTIGKKIEQYRKRIRA